VEEEGVKKEGQEDAQHLPPFGQRIFLHKQA